jgi:hypothetical protein
VDQLDDLAKYASLRRELEAARAAGVSWRRYAGWEPERRTRFVYEDGQLVEAITTTEPEWDDDQRAAVEALLAYEASLCPGCRQVWAEVTAPEAEGRFVPDAPIRCHYCTARAQGEAIYAGSDHSGALFATVRDRQREAQDG